MSGYNQEVGGGNGSVREGNWFEELALKDVTGVRFYPNPKGKDSSLMTTSRCITHTDQTLAKDYISTMSVDIQNPYESKAYHLLVKKDIGPRKQRMDAMIKAQVEAEFKEKTAAAYTVSRQVDYSTSTQRALDAVKPGFVPYLDRP